MIIIKIDNIDSYDNSHNYDNNNDNNSDNGENNDDNNDNKLPVGSPHKGPIMLSFDVTFVEPNQQSSFRWFETPCPSRSVNVMWYICATSSYRYCWK